MQHVVLVCGHDSFISQLTDAEKSSTLHSNSKTDKNIQLVSSSYHSGILTIPQWVWVLIWRGRRGSSSFIINKYGVAKLGRVISVFLQQAAWWQVPNPL